MKIHPQLQSKFTNFCREYSSEIEYDSIIRYVNSVSLFLDEKIEDLSEMREEEVFLKLLEVNHISEEQSQELLAAFREIIALEEDEGIV